MKDKRFMHYQRIKETDITQSVFFLIPYHTDSEHLSEKE